MFILNGKWPLRKKLLTRLTIIFTIICSLCMPCADPENFLGGGGIQIPRRGLAENFNMAKINNLAIPGGGGPDPLSPPPLDPSMYAYLSGHFYFFSPRFLGWDFDSDRASS